MNIDLENLELPRVEGDRVIFKDTWLAIHEAGHAVIAEIIGFKVKSITIDRNNPGVILEIMDATSRQGPTHFGGYLATERAQGVSTEPEHMCKAKPLGCDVDRANASNCARHDWKQRPDEADLTAGQITKIRQEYLTGCQAIAWQIIDQYWDKVLGLAEQLLEEPTMDGDRCRAVLSSI